MGIRVSATHSWEITSQLPQSPGVISTRLIQELQWLGRTCGSAWEPGFFEDLKDLLFSKGLQLTEAFDLAESLRCISRGTFFEIETTPELDGVPFELLTTDGECLGLRNPVSRILSLGAMPSPLNRFSQTPRVLVITTSHPKPSLVLDGETETLRDIFEHQGFRVRTWNWADAPDGGEITQFQQLLTSADIVHLAGHLEIREGDACFQMDGEQDLWLPASRFREMEMNASIVWLSTCSGAVTEGIQSFAQAALCGGVSVCVGASVPVADTHMSTACRRFYRKLFEGHCAGHAMLECRQQLARLGSTAWTTTLLLGHPRWAPPIIRKPRD